MPKLTEAQLDAWKDGVLLSGAAGPWPARCTELIAECYRLRALVEKAYTEGRQDQRSGRGRWLISQVKAAL